MSLSSLNLFKRALWAEDAALLTGINHKVKFFNLEKSLTNSASLDVSCCCAS
jgi:hypothetical protein